MDEHLEGDDHDAEQPVESSREQGYHTVVVALAGALNGLLGVVIVALKVLVH